MINVTFKIIEFKKKKKHVVDGFINEWVGR
jgi:hypothetical protein